MSAPTSRVLVTGLTGFTGIYLDAALQAAGFEVHGTARPGETTDARLHAVELSDVTGLRELIASIAPRHVVHLAAVSFVGHGDVDEIYRTNLLGTRNLLSALAASRSDASRLGTVLLASSANIYGNAETSLIAETCPAQPTNDYAVSKAAMEQMAALWSAELPITVVRPFNYTGVGQSRRFLIPKIVDAFSRRSNVIELGNLDVYRDFSDVRDVARCYADLLEASPRRTLNICSGRVHSLREILSMATSLSGHQLEVRVNPDFVRANEVKVLQGSDAQLRGILPAWAPRPLEETIEWMLSSAGPDGSSAAA